MALLRQLTEEMAHLGPQIKQAGGNVPLIAIPRIYRFFELTTEMLNEDLTMSEDEDQ